MYTWWCTVKVRIQSIISKAQLQSVTTQQTDINWILLLEQAKNVHKIDLLSVFSRTMISFCICRFPYAIALLLISLFLCAGGISSDSSTLAVANSDSSFNISRLRRRLSDLQNFTAGVAQYITHHHHHSLRSSFLPDLPNLKNEEVIFLISSTSKNKNEWLRERIIPAARTWMREFRSVFVLVEDSFDTRFSMRFCDRLETEHYTSFSCQNEPTYVLSRTCSNEYYGSAGPCCKVDSLFNYVANDRPDLFSKMKYAFHADDDTFFRGAMIMKWLQQVELSGVSHLPIVSNKGHGTNNNGGLWHVHECTEIHTLGWYQPMMVNHRALESMRVAVAHGGVADTCMAFDVTHDVGMGPFFWLFEPYHLQMPHTEGNGAHLGKAVFKPDQMIVHFIKPKAKTEGCYEGEGWPDAAKYVQSIVVGCGDLNHSAPLHDPWAYKELANMYDAWNYFKENGTEWPVVQESDGWVNISSIVVTIDEVDATTGQRLQSIRTYPSSVCADKTEVVTMLSADGITEKSIVSMDTRTLPTPRLNKLKGYKQTAHGQENDVTKVWKAFTMEDCVIKGYLNNR